MSNSKLGAPISGQRSERPALRTSGRRSLTSVRRLVVPRAPWCEFRRPIVEGCGLGGVAPEGDLRGEGVHGEMATEEASSQPQASPSPLILSAAPPPLLLQHSLAPASWRLFQRWGPRRPDPGLRRWHVGVKQKQFSEGKSRGSRPCSLCITRGRAHCQSDVLQRGSFWKMART